MESTYVKPPKTMMELYRGLPEGTLVQLINDRSNLYPSHTDPHQEALNKILMPIGNYLEGRKYGRLVLGPFDVYLDDQNAFQPDLLFALSENVYKIRHDGFYGAPDLVIEILEQPTQELDEGEKKVVCERSGVKEYWRVDPIDKTTEGFWLVNDEFQPLPSEVGTIQFRLFDFAINF